MATIMYSDQRYYSSHFESMAQQWRQMDNALAGALMSVVRYFRNRSAKRYLRELPDYLLDDIGISREQLQ